MEHLLARWESRSGKHWANLYYNPEFKLANGRIVIDAHYCAPDCAGGIAAESEADAVAKMQARVDRGYFQPDANKLPMRMVQHAPANSGQAPQFQTTNQMTEGKR